MAMMHLSSDMIHLYTFLISKLTFSIMKKKKKETHKATKKLIETSEQTG